MQPSDRAKSLPSVRAHRSTLWRRPCCKPVEVQMRHKQHHPDKNARTNSQNSANTPAFIHVGECAAANRRKAHPPAIFQRSMPLSKHAAPITGQGQVMPPEPASLPLFQTILGGEFFPNIVRGKEGADSPLSVAPQSQTPATSPAGRRSSLQNGTSSAWSASITNRATTFLSPALSK